MSSFKRYSFNNKFIVNIFFSECQYARTSVKIQHIENIEFVDEIKVVGNTFKTLLLSNPFDGKGNYFHFSRKGNNFENISSGKNLFFLTSFFENDEFAQYSNILLHSQKKRYICFGGRNSACPHQRGKKK